MRSAELDATGRIGLVKGKKKKELGGTGALPPYRNLQRLDLCKQQASLEIKLEDKGARKAAHPLTLVSIARSALCRGTEKGDGGMAAGGGWWLSEAKNSTHQCIGVDTLPGNFALMVLGRWDLTLPGQRYLRICPLSQASVCFVSIISGGLRSG